jgi:hypothetical protein
MFAENQRYNTMNTSQSPKKTNITDDKVLYVNKIISISPYLQKFYDSYAENKDNYKKAYDKAIDYGMSDFYTLSDFSNKPDANNNLNETYYLNEKILIITNMEKDPYHLFHVCLAEFSFKNLSVNI